MCILRQFSNLNYHLLLFLKQFNVRSMFEAVVVDGRLKNLSRSHNCYRMLFIWHVHAINLNIFFVFQCTWAKDMWIMVLRCYTTNGTCTKAATTVTKWIQIALILFLLVCKPITSASATKRSGYKYLNNNHISKVSTADSYDFSHQLFTWRCS